MALEVDLVVRVGMASCVVGFVGAFKDNMVWCFVSDGKWSGKREAGSGRNKQI